MNDRIDPSAAAEAPRSRRFSVDLPHRPRRLRQSETMRRHVRETRLHPSQLILPTLTLALVVAPYIARMMRATMIDVLDSGYVEMARLKGVPERRVIFRHAVPHALGPVAQVVAIGGTLGAAALSARAIFQQRLAASCRRVRTSGMAPTSITVS